MSKSKFIETKNSSFSLLIKQIHTFFNTFNLQLSRVPLLFIVLFSAVIFGGYFHTVFSKNQHELVNLSPKQECEKTIKFEHSYRSSHVNCNSLIYSQNEFDVTFSESEDDDERTSKSLMFYSANFTTQLGKFSTKLVKCLTNTSTNYVHSNLYILFLVFRI